MARNTDTTADWQSVDVETLPAGLSALYSDLKAAQRLAAQARDAFEAAFSEMATVPSSQRLLFGYRFGKLSIALVDGPAEPRKPAKPTLSFATLARHA